jgi:hypothetical protein
MKLISPLGSSYLQNFDCFLSEGSKKFVFAMTEIPDQRSSFYLEVKKEKTLENKENKEEFVLSKELIELIQSFDEKVLCDYYLNDFRQEFLHRFDKSLQSNNILCKLQTDYSLQIAELLKVKPLEDGINCYWTERQDYENGYYLGEINEGGDKHGRGFYYWTCGDIYVGQWRIGERTGSGKTYDSEGRLVYEGEYLNGQRNGKGVFYLQNGDCFKGDFKNDCFHGAGIYYWNDNISWSGSFVDDKFHGVGVFVFENGKSKLREFKMGELVN